VSDEKGDLTPAERVVNIIEMQWDSAWKDSLRVFGSVLSAALGEVQ